MKIIAHRGNCGFAPENSLEAFKQAIDLGADYVECDPLKTKDDILVIHHDWTIDRLSNGTGDIRELTFEELSQYDYGDHKNFGDKYKNTPIMKAEDIFAYFKERDVNFYIDVSIHAPYVKPILEKVNVNMDRVRFMTGNMEETILTHQIFPDSPIDYGMACWFEFLKADNKEEYVKNAVKNHITGWTVYYHSFINAGEEKELFADLSNKYNMFWGMYFAPDYDFENEYTIKRAMEWTSRNGSKPEYVMTDMPGIAKKLLK